MTANVMHPVPGFLSGGPIGWENPAGRARKIVECFSKNSIDIVFLQEFFSPLSAELKSAGYEIIQPVKKSGKFFEKFTDMLGGHPEYTGLAIAIKKGRCWLKSAQFEAYDRNNQANCFSSWSGSLRTDGLLFVEIEFRGQRMWLIDTHLESFNKKINDSQVNELAEKINSIRKNYEEDEIFFAGDFNRSTRCLQTRLAEMIGASILNTPIPTYDHKEDLDAIFSVEKTSYGNDFSIDRQDICEKIVDGVSDHRFVAVGIWQAI